MVRLVTILKYFSDAIQAKYGPLNDVLIKLHVKQKFFQKNTTNKVYSERILRYNKGIIKKLRKEQFNMTFSEFISTECKKRGIKLKQMCDDCGINYHGFATTYKARKTRPEWVIAISHYFNADLETLLLMEVK